MKKSPPKLNGDTPRWFYDWHTQCYEPRMSKNERILYVVIGVLIASSIAANTDIIGAARALMGG